MGVQRVTIAAVLAMVTEQAQRRVRNGEATERGMALRAGVSQPYLHNVLKGARQMSPDLADRLLREFNMGVPEVLADSLGRPPLVIRIGPGSERRNAQARERASR